MPSLLEKLDSLPIGKYEERDQYQIRAWRDRYVELEVQNDFIKHPKTQELAKTAREAIEHANNRLANEEALTIDPSKALERARIFAEKRVHEQYLRSFSEDPTGEMKALEEIVDGELSRKN